MKAPSDKELQAVLNLDGPGRYRHFVKRVADFAEVWSLWNDGWALMGDESAGQLIPVWPHSRYAELCATGQWVEYRPKSISLDDWMKRWIPGMIGDGRSVAVFPTGMLEAVVVSPSRLYDDLAEELGAYE